MVQCIIRKSSARRSGGFAIRCQKMFDHFPPGICNPHPLYLYFILKQPARRSGRFSIRKSPARRSSGFAIRCQKMFDHFPLGICNPHPLSLYFILPPGVLADSQSESLPSGVPADLQSAVKKCSTTFPWGFAIPILFICISF